MGSLFLKPTAALGSQETIGSGWLPRSCGSQFFWLTGNRVLKTAFVLWDGPLDPQPPQPSEVRPFEPWCQQHRGSLRLRLRLRRLGIPHPPGPLGPSPYAISALSSLLIPEAWGAPGDRDGQHGGVEAVARAMAQNDRRTADRRRWLASLFNRPRIAIKNAVVAV